MFTPPTTPHGGRGTVLWLTHDHCRGEGGLNAGPYIVASFLIIHGMFKCRRLARKLGMMTTSQRIRRNCTRSRPDKLLEDDAQVESQQGNLVCQAIVRYAFIVSGCWREIIDEAWSCFKISQQSFSHGTPAVKPKEHVNLHVLLVSYCYRFISWEGQRQIFEYDSVGSTRTW